MRNIILAAATAAALLAGATAVAAGGFYVSPQIGFGGMQTPKPDAGAVFSNYKIGGFAYRLDAGYLMPINQSFNVGAEAGYSGYADNKYTSPIVSGTVKYTGHYFDLLGVTQYNFNDKINVFAKFGPAYITQKVSGPIGSHYTSSETKHSVKAELALGGAYQFNKNIGLNLNIYHVFGSKPAAAGDSTATASDYEKIASVTTFMVGMQYTFA